VAFAIHKLIRQEIIRHRYPMAATRTAAPG